MFLNKCEALSNPKYLILATYVVFQKYYWENVMMVQNKQNTLNRETEVDLNLMRLRIFKET